MVLKLVGFLELTLTNKCLPYQKFKSHLQDILAKQDLFQLIKSRSMEDEKKVERWKLLGHVIRMENNKSWLYNDTLQMVGEP